MQVDIESINHSEEDKISNQQISDRTSFNSKENEQKKLFH
jgi:hypothetical protein